MAEPRGEIGGPRHYAGPTLGQVAAWKCPACGTENTTPFAEGCPTCGANTGETRARHVGVPPRADTRRPPPIVIAIDSALAFDQWLKQRIQDDVNPARVSKLRDILYEAWRGAVEWYQSIQPSVHDPNPAPDVLAADVRMVPKTLLDRVVMTLESTTDLPDDQQSPELLALISELKELLE